MAFIALAALFSFLVVEGARELRLDYLLIGGFGLLATGIALRATVRPEGLT